MRKKPLFYLSIIVIILLFFIFVFGLSNDVLLWVCIFLCISQYIFILFNKIKHEKEYISFENELLKNSYNEIKEQYEINSRLYHDMKSHFSMVQSYLNEDKIELAQEYLKQLIDNNDLAFVEKWTGVDVIDYILSQAQDKANRNNINLEIHAEYPKDCKINPIDLCTILTNTINNAFESCYAQETKSERKIAITIRRIHQFIIIRVINTTDQKPIIKEGRLVTTKEDSINHGWGTRCIKSSVEKYQGTLKYEYEEPYFSVSVMLFYQ